MAISWGQQNEIFTRVKTFICEKLSQIKMLRSHRNFLKKMLQNTKTLQRTGPDSSPDQRILYQKSGPTKIQTGTDFWYRPAVHD